jgi:hypothetical protein
VAVLFAKLRIYHFGMTQTDRQAVLSPILPNTNKVTSLRIRSWNQRELKVNKYVTSV